MIWIPVFLMLATLVLVELQRYGKAPGSGWLPRLLPFVFAGAAVWFVAALLLTVDMKAAVVSGVGLLQSLEARHASLVTALLALSGAALACVGFARVAWIISEALCEPPESTARFGLFGPAALGLLGAVLLALAYMRL